MPNLYLKPCPFCGNEKALRICTIAECDQLDECEQTEYDRSHWLAVCSVNHGGCGASTGMGNSSPQKAAESWNRRAQMIGKWIPVSERLPELHDEFGGWSEDVLVIVETPDYGQYYYDIFVGYYAPEYGWYTCMHNNCHEVGIRKVDFHSRKFPTGEKVVAWMPLPAVPDDLKKANEVDGTAKHVPDCLW